MQRTQRMQRNATDAYVAICMQRTQRMQRNATDVYVAICTKACYGFNAIALTQHLRRCDTSLARVVVITERSTRALHTTLCTCDTRVNRIVWLPSAAHLRWAAATRAVCGPCMVLTARWHVSQAAKPVTCLKNRVFGQNACFACRTLKKHVYKRGTRDTLVSGSLRAPSLAEPIHPPKSVRSFQRKRFFGWAKLLHPQKKTGFWSDPPGGRGRLKGGVRD